MRSHNTHLLIGARRLMVLLALLLGMFLIYTSGVLALTAPAGTLDANTLPVVEDPGWPVWDYTNEQYIIAQTFTPTNSGNIVAAQLQMSRAHYPAADLRFQVVGTDANGNPTDNVLAQDFIQASSVRDARPGDLATANFDPPAPVESGQQYALTVDFMGPAGSYYYFPLKGSENDPGSDTYNQGVYKWRHLGSATNPWTLAFPEADTVFAIYLNGSQPTYAFQGFFRPVDNNGVYNSVKAGSAVPIKFSLGGDMGMDVLSEVSPPSVKTLPKATGITVDPIEQTVNATTSGLSYDPGTGQYTYVWKTSKDWAGQDKQLTITLADGTTHTALFRFTK
jgi:hypothetical protein